MFYDIEMIEQNGLEDIYELQEKGQWTWDVFVYYTKKLTADKDGNGTPDIWGCVVPNPSEFFKNLVYSNNGKFVAEAENGDTISTINSSKVIKTFNYFNELVNVHKSVLALGTGNSFEIAKQVMTERRGAIYAYNTNPLTENKERLGMVYYPKGPDADKYIAAYDASGFYAIPASVNNPEDICVILKELISKSAYDHSVDYYKNKYNERDFKIIKYALDNPEFYYYSSLSLFYVHCYRVVNNIINTPYITESLIKEAIEEANVNAQAYLDGL